MDIFGSSTLPGWQADTPGQYRLKLVADAKSIADTMNEGFAAGSGAVTRGMDVGQQGRALNQKSFETVAPPDSDWQVSPTWMQNNPVGYGTVLRRQSGGPVPAGQPTIVGEDGPEVIVPRRDVEVIPNDAPRTFVDAGRTNWTDSTPAQPAWLAREAAPTNLFMQRPSSTSEFMARLAQARNWEDLAAIKAVSADMAVKYPWVRNEMTKAEIRVNKQYADELQLKQQQQSLRTAEQTAKNNSVASKILLDDARTFNNRIGAIAPEDRASIIAMDKNPDGTISRAQWQALSLAEQTLAERQEQIRLRAEIEARERGDQQRTVISDKGVVKTFTPPGSPSAPTTPQEMTLSQGERIVYNPKTGALTMLDKKGGELPFTHAQFLTLAKDLKESEDADDKAKGASIMRVLAGKAMQQMTNAPVTVQATNAPTARSTNAPAITPPANNAPAIPKVQNRADAEKAIQLYNAAIKEGKKDPKILKDRLQQMFEGTDFKFHDKE